MLKYTKALFAQTYAATAPEDQRALYAAWTGHAYPDRLADLASNIVAAIAQDRLAAHVDGRGVKAHFLALRKP